MSFLTDRPTDKRFVDYKIINKRNIKRTKEANKFTFFIQIITDEQPNGRTETRTDRQMDFSN